MKLLLLTILGFGIFVAGLRFLLRDFFMFIINRLRITNNSKKFVDFGEHALKGRVGNVRLYGVIGLKGCDRSIYDQVHDDLKRHTAVIDMLKGGQLPPLRS